MAEPDLNLIMERLLAIQTDMREIRSDITDVRATLETLGDSQGNMILRIERDIVQIKLYTALRAANVPENTAREAAEEIAGYENRFVRLESGMTVLKWMVGTNIVVTVAVFLKLFLR